MNDAISVSSFCAMKDAFTQLIAQQGEALISKLMKRIESVGNLPFREHLKDILANVLIDGVDFVKYREHRDQLYGFDTHQKLMQELKRVQELWEGQIDMRRTDEGYFYSSPTPEPSEKAETLLFAQVIQGTAFHTGLFDEDAFMEAILFALHNGKDPIRALGILADEGAAKLDRTSPTWTNAFGT